MPIIGAQHLWREDSGGQGMEKFRICPGRRSRCISHAIGACHVGRNRASHLEGKASPRRPSRTRHSRGHYMGKSNSISHVAIEVVVNISFVHMKCIEENVLGLRGQSTSAISHVMTSPYMSLRSNPITTTILYKKRISSTCACEGRCE